MRLLKMECEKAFRNRYFISSVIIGMIFSILSLLYSVGTYEKLKEDQMIMSGNQMFQCQSLYNSWIGGEVFSLGFSLFYTLCPLLAALPYGWSYCREKSSGYLKSIVTRCRKRDYYMAKYTAVFLSGGTAVLIPLLANFILTACFIPAYKPSLGYALYYSIQSGSMLSGLFYRHPLLFVIVYLGLDFLFAGLFAVISYAASIFIRNWVAVTLFPFFSMLGLHYCRTFLRYKCYKEISPLNFLHATNVENPVSVWIVVVEGCILFVIPLFLILREGVKGEIL